MTKPYKGRDESGKTSAMMDSALMSEQLTARTKYSGKFFK